MRTLALAAVLAAVAGSALADEVYLNNGDRITGEIVSAEGGSLVIMSPSAGEVTIPLADVASFATDKPIELHLNDGSVMRQPVKAGGPGEISTAGEGPVQGVGIPLSSIRSINPPPAQPVKWKGALTAGVMLTRGNTHTDSADAALELVRRAEKDRISLNAIYTYAREKAEGEDPRVTRENWMASAKYDYFVNDKWYVYANLRVERDHIANLDLRLTPGVGTGYQWIETAKTNFNTEAGLTWVYERYTDPDDTRDFLAGRLAYHFDHKLNDNVTFIHNLEVLPSLEDFGEYLLTTDAGLRAKLTKDFFGEAKVVYQYNSEPAEGKDKSDVRYMLNVGWTF